MTPPIQHFNDPPSGENGISVREWLSAINEKLDRNDEKLDRILQNLYGDGDKTGLYTRVDRLEQAEVRRNVWSVAAITAAVGSAITSMWSFASHGK